MLKPKKLIISVFTLVLTAVTLTSSTYAWFARNNEAWTEDFSLNIENTANLLISVDGKSFKASLNNEDIKMAYASKVLNKPISELTEDEIDSEYSKLQLATVSSKDLSSFTTVDSKAIENGYYKQKDASVYSYLSFDIYFRNETSQDVLADAYDLKLADNAYALENGVRATGFKAEDSTVKLNNALTALDTLGNVVKYGPTEKKESETDGYDRTAIVVNPVNALRLGFSYGESINIYEPNIGYGSYPIESHRGLNDIYDPTNNAMLTYFNNIYEYKLNTLTDDSYKDTYKNLGEGSVGVFQKNDDGLTYNDVKITTYIWLEGYDADFIPGIDINQISAYLCFYKSERGGTI